MSFGVVMQQRRFTINYSKEINFQILPREIQHTNQLLSTEYEKTPRKLRYIHYFCCCCFSVCASVSEAKVL